MILGTASFGVLNNTLPLVLPNRLVSQGDECAKQKRLPPNLGIERGALENVLIDFTYSSYAPMFSCIFRSLELTFGIRLYEIIRLRI